MTCSTCTSRASNLSLSDSTAPDWFPVALYLRAHLLVPIVSSRHKTKAHEPTRLLGFFAYSHPTVQTSSHSTLLYVFLVGAGYGGMLSVALVATVAAVPHHDQAVPTSATYAFRSTGSTTGVTIASAVNQNLLQADLHRHFDGREGLSRCDKTHRGVLGGAESPAEGLRRWRPRSQRGCAVGFS